MTSLTPLLKINGLLQQIIATGGVDNCGDVLHLSPILQMLIMASV